jgi:hypothetical protein
MAALSRHLALAVCLVLVALSAAQAEQPRDFMIAPGKNGTDVMLDLVFPGMQATVEHRIPIYGIVNQFTLRANSLLTLPFYESQADAELRILALTFGASGGFRHELRGLHFADDETLSRTHRRLREIDGDVSSDTWGFGEGRVTLSVPFNDLVVLNAINSLRYQGSPDRTFDWRNGIVDDGTLFKSDIMLFFKHRDWGGFAPMMQVLNFDLDGARHTQFNYGFMAVTRPGFRHRDDIFLLQLLVHPGGSLGGIDNSDSYGMHLFYASFTFNIAYRMVFPVWRPE